MCMRMDDTLEGLNRLRTTLEDTSDNDPHVHPLR